MKNLFPGFHGSMKAWIRRAFVALAIAAICLVLVPQLVLMAGNPYGTQTFVGPTSSPLILTMDGTSNSCYVRETQASGFVPGPINAWGSNDGINYLTPLAFTPTTVVNPTPMPTPLTPTNKVDYNVGPVGFMFVEIIADSSWNAGTQQATVIGRCSASIAKTFMQSTGGGGGGNINCTGLASCPPGPSPTINVPSPSPTASSTGCGTLSITSTFPYIWNLNTSSCQAGSSAYTPAPGATPNYDSVILARSSTTHYWKMADNPNGCSSNCTPGPCPSSMADSVTSGATAVPSAVPLVTTTPPATPQPTCGVPSPVKDGETFAMLNNENSQTGAAFIIPQGIIGTICNGNAGGNCTNSFSIECIVVPDFVTTNNGYFYGDDTNTNNFDFLFNLVSGGGSLVYEHNGSGSSINGTTGSFVAYDIAYTNNGSTGALYVNGSDMFNALSVPVVAANVKSSFGFPGGSATYRGRIGKCSTSNVALTQAQVFADYLASALP